MNTNDDIMKTQLLSHVMPESTSQALLPDLLLSIMEQLNTMMDAERTTVFLYDELDNHLWSAVNSGNQLKTITFPATQGIAGYVMNSGKVLNIPDAYQDDRFNPEIDKRTGFKTRSILCVPIIDYEGYCIGVVQALNKRTQQPFSKFDEKLLTTLATQAASTIENTQLRENEKLLTEELTQNHRRLQKAFIEIEENNARLQDRLVNKAYYIRTALIILLIVGGGLTVWLSLGKLSLGNLANHQETQKTVSNQSITQVKTQEVSDWLRLNGSIRPVEWIEVVSPLDSVVQSTNFHYGEAVNKGQILAKLSTRKHQVQHRDANSAYIQALTEMERLQNWNKSLEVLRAKRELAKAKESLSSHQRKLLETQRLFNKGIISRSELDNAEISVKESKLALLSAKESLQSTLAQGSKRKQSIAKLALENAKQKLEDIEMAIKQAAIISPANGIIFSNTQNTPENSTKGKTIHVGSRVSVDTPLFAIANFQGITIESDVSESNIIPLKRGQPAKITFPALPDMELEGQISFISGRAARDTNKQSSTFKVKVTVHDINEQQRHLLRIGMSAIAKIRTYHNPNAIVIPFNAVTIEDESHYVTIYTSDKNQQQREITIRSAHLNGVEITKGLVVGENILITQ